jgi:PAP2 superfamily
MRNAVKYGIVLVALAIGNTDRLAADEVLDWNNVFNQAIVKSPFASALAFRQAAIVHASIFDAYNGIDRRFEPIHVTELAPKDASARAAVVQAAYASMVHLFAPAQQALLDAQLTESLTELANDKHEDPAGIALGLAWGQHVADLIWTWRSGDGYDPSPSTFSGNTGVGQWRPTPPAFANALFPYLPTSLTWIIPSPSSFRPPGPPELTSAQYTADFNEVKAIGQDTSTVRTADQTQAAQFWFGTALTFWNRAAAANSVKRHLSLGKNARLFALLNVAMADGAISCWDAKYFYNFWRPITAIRLADTDGNPDTAPDATWSPLRANPPYQEYTSGHATVSGAGQEVLTEFFGKHVPVSGWSETFGPGTNRSWPSFSAAADEANLSRIWVGIHFRTAVVDGRAAGNAIAAYVMKNGLQRLHGHDDGDQGDDDDQGDQGVD